MAVFFLTRAMLLSVWLQVPFKGAVMVENRGKEKLGYVGISQLQKKPIFVLDIFL